MNRYQILIEYEGTKFFGWQIQKNVNTIQKLVQSKISKILKEKIIFDLRNIYIPEDLKELEFKYYGTGK